MPLQEQCCTAEHGKRMVELGVKAEATFWHMPEKSHLHKKYIRYGWHSDAIAPAYTSGELGHLLPSPIVTGKVIVDNGDGEKMGFTCHIDDAAFTHIEIGETEAEARAQLLIHLLENNLIRLDTLEGVPCRHCGKMYYGANCDNRTCPGPVTVGSRKVQVTHLPDWITENISHLRNMTDCEKIVCAWGASGVDITAINDEDRWPGLFYNKVVKLLRGRDNLYYLGLTENDQPRHPLFLPYTASLSKI